MQLLFGPISKDTIKCINCLQYIFHDSMVHLLKILEHMDGHILFKVFVS